MMDKNKLLEINNLFWNCCTENLSAAEAQERRLWYGWLFEGTSADISIPLWESAYVGEKDVLLNKDTLETVKCYYAENLEAAGQYNQPADYIGFELEFFIYLISAKKVEKAREFYNNHLRILMKNVFERVLENSKNNYYSKLAEEAVNICSQLDKAGFIEDLSKNSGAVLKEFSCCHFIPVSNEYIEKALEVKKVKSAGRGNCGGCCGIRVDTAAGCVLDVGSCEQGENPLTAPLCVRGKNYRGTYLVPGRLRYPMLRVGKRGQGLFKRISWNQAMDILAEKITHYTEKYGPGCRFVGYSSGVCSVLSGDYVLRRMFGLSGGYLGNFNSYSSACIFYTLPYVYGTAETGSSLASFYDTKLVILWGNNPVVTEHTDEWTKLIRKLKEKKTKVILIDPHFNESGKALNAEWIPIRPDTDAALAASIAYVLWEENLCNQKFMDEFCLGFDNEHMPSGFENEESYKDYIFGIKDGIVKNPEWAEVLTGIPAEKIRYIARLYADGPAAIFAGRGAQRNSMGEQNVRCITALTCMMGYVGVKGAGTGYHCETRTHQMPAYPKGDNSYKGKIPNFLWTEAVLDGKNMTRQKDHIQGLDKLESDIKIMFSIAGNTFMNQHSDLNYAAEVLKDESKCEFITVSDTFMTSTARYADLLLPGTSLFEDEYIAKPWGDGNYILYGNKCTDPLFESRFEVEWILELAEKLGIEGLAEGCKSVEEWHRFIYDRVRKQEAELPEFEDFKANGGYHFKNNPEQIAFKNEVSDPETYRFPTESGKIEIFSKNLWEYKEKEIPAIPKYIKGFEGINDPVRERYPLQLIGWHTKRRTHSIGDNNKNLEKTEPHRLWINPEDAAIRGLSEGDLSEVYNDRGKIRIKIKITEDIMPGVICIPQGAWFTPDADGTDIRGNVNTLTTHEATALAKANPQHSCLAEVRKAVLNVLNS